jgi:hypothetical protein
MGVPVKPMKDAWAARLCVPGKTVYEVVLAAVCLVGVTTMFCGRKAVGIGSRPSRGELLGGGEDHAAARHGEQFP